MKKRKWILLGLLAAPVLPVVCFFFPTIRWVGQTDLEVVFIVTDRNTNARISGADVTFGSFGQDEFLKGEVQLKTDAVGIASHVLESVTSSGRSNALEWKDTFNVNVAFWQYRVSAVGYEPTDFILLRSHVKAGSVKRNGPGKSLIEVPVKLRKSDQ